MKKTRKADGFENQYLFVISQDFLSTCFGDPLFSHMRITDIGFFPIAQYHFRSRSEGCDTAILLYCVDGEGYYTLKGHDRKTLAPGQAVLIPPGIAHEYAASEENPWSIYWMHVNGLMIQPLWDRMSQRLPLTIDRKYEMDIIGLFHQCFGVLKRPIQSEEYYLLCQTASNILGLIWLAGKQTEHPMTEKGEKAIQRALDYMKQKLHESISLTDIADAANYSASHLNALFKRTTGKTPVEYYLHMKMQAASKELYFTARPIKDIAIEYGIHDSCYFSRLFKKNMGMAPQEYRNLTKG